jgi:transposase InsO family protein
MQDCFSKSVEMSIAIATKKTIVVAQAFMTMWVSRFICPRVLHQDNGLKFTGGVFVKVCSMMGIDRTTTTPYFPQGNGPVERVNQTL